MSDDHSFIEYCEKCGTSFTHRFNKDMLENKGAGLFSGIFLHKSKNSQEIHAMLAYFDTNLASRGGEGSKVIITNGVSLEHLKKSSASHLDDEVSKKEMKVFYEWLLNQYIDNIKNKRMLARRRVEPVLNKVLSELKTQSELYEPFMVVSDKIVFDLQKKEIQAITYNELKEIYQTLFEQIIVYFKDENEKDALEASRKLGLKVITQWRDIVKLGISEDVLRILETHN
ncbi:MAG: hypothetical protein ACXACR_17160 [Candidatus Hodarchaeales archaeon]|jgi:hypothetical protein